ncbi:hypothetical protein ES703_92797 [subsurface metagenome]
MMIYIALIKSKDEGHPSKLIVRDVEREIKEYLLSLPVAYVVETFAVYNGETKATKYYSLRDLVAFLKD